MTVAEFTVIGQVPRRRINPVSGEVEDVMEVTFRDDVTGVADSVDVPEAQYGPDVARQLIADRVAKIRAVQALSE